MKRGSRILKMIAFGILALGAIGFATQFLWNRLVPVLFAGPMITYWQALGLLLLSKILFWSFGKRHYSGGYCKPYWKEKWNMMTDEEKSKFRQKMKEKCGLGTSVQHEKYAGE